MKKIIALVMALAMLSSLFVMTGSAEEKAEREKRKEYWNELVEVKLFKDNNKYKDDVFVSVNGENCLIKRGERVKIKRKFAEVLEQSDMQDAQTARLIESAMEVKKVADM